ncbi:MAG: ABC transporter permease [Tatlockia sp.]|nr:ABC transporter permease [Tatlockia sp.]
MTLLTHFQQALVNLAASKLRSFLAILGILVGTAAVVALISCGQLATEKALEQFKTLGTDLLAIAAYETSQAKASSGSNQVSLAFWRQLPEHIPSILRVAPYSTGYQGLSFEGKIIRGAIIGADESLAKVINIHLISGHFVSYLDSFEHFCVIGNSLAKQIQEVSMDEPLGKQLRIGNNFYTIIGIAAPWKESGFFNEDINQAVIIPIAGMAMISKDSKIANAIFELKPDSKIDEVIAQIKLLLSTQAPKLSIFSRSAKQIIASMENQGQIFTLLLAVIGGISLLVGGIGVMNVMLVSVSERKKEIGVRKAVGAKNREIQALFLVESIMLSFLGGVLGVSLGLIFTRIVAYFFSWNFNIFLMPPLAGFAVSVATGVFFGFYPAKRAANLEPMASLRSE